MKTIHIMPHHFLDILRANAPAWEVPLQSKLGHQLSVAVETIFNEPLTKLVIAFGKDDICKGCDARKNGRCTSPLDTDFRKGAPDNLQDYNENIDTRIMNALNLKAGDELTALELCQKFADTKLSYHSIYKETPTETMDAWTNKIEAGIERFLTEAGL